MPLVNFHLRKGWTEDEITRLLDTAHDVFVEALEIPVGDRYQLVNQYEPYEMILKDTDLGFKRSDKAVLITVTSRPRSEKQKKKLYHDLVVSLGSQCGIAPEDIMISFVINGDEDWSFAFGRAQFLTGDL